MLVATILFVAAVVQGLVGFALAVVAIPFLVWHGLALSEAIAISAAATLIQAVTGMIKLRRAIPWDVVRPAVTVRLLVLPLGIMILVQLNQLSTATVKAFVGACIIVLVLLQVILKVKPRERLPAVWNYLAFASSGLFAGMVGMGGPPLVLWISAHRWEGDKIRAFLFANFTILAPLNLFLIWRSFGQPALSAMGMGLLVAPVVVVGGLIGVKLGTHIPRELFRKILFGILIAIGVGSIVAAWWS